MPSTFAGPTADKDLSLVIPAYNEASFLPRLLDTIDVARDRYSGGRDAIEVIVADNSSTDATADIARSRGCKVAKVRKRVIGAARNGGAAIATAPIVCFVDADMQIHPDTFNAITRAMADPRFIGGATGVKMERWSAGIVVTFAAALGLIWLTGMDTGVVFCRRDDFNRLGGYSEDRHYAEDIDFLWKLIKLGRTRHQRLTRLRPVKAIASTRKFDRYGDWHYFSLLLPLTRGMLNSSRSGNKAARDYWYNDR
jgi:glycosyltransferase involved in cell wall biosynthesis